MTAWIGLFIVAGVNLLAIGVAFGTLRQQVKDLPAVINGTAIRPHEKRCFNYQPKPMQTNPRIPVFTTDTSE